MSESTADIAARFVRDIGPHAHGGSRPPARGHEMTVLHDDGMYRHLLCKSPDGSAYWFELITAPGSLTFRGDGDAFVFARSPDMFGFFRGSSPTAGTRKPYGVNPHYWSEKIEHGGRASAMTYDPDRFVQLVKEATVEAIRYGGAPRGIGRAVKRMLDDGLYDTEADARRELEDFEHGAGVRITCSCGAGQTVPDYAAESSWRFGHRMAAADPGSHRFDSVRVEGFRFTDTWEWDLRDYDWWFLWACHAIVWAIARYDEAKAAAPAAAPRRSRRSAFRRTATIAGA